MPSAFVRRQYLVTDDNITKLKRISRELGCSKTEVVRRAIDSYDPDNENEEDLQRLVELMSDGVTDALKKVRETRKEVRAANKAYKKMHSI